MYSFTCKKNPAHSLVLRVRFFLKKSRLAYIVYIRPDIRRLWSDPRKNCFWKKWIKANPLKEEPACHFSFTYSGMQHIQCCFWKAINDLVCLFVSFLCVDCLHNQHLNIAVLFGCTQWNACFLYTSIKHSVPRGNWIMAILLLFPRIYSVWYSYQLDQ